MRAGALLPGVAAVGVLALPGCGGDDDVRTVTVTAPGAATRPATTARATASRPTTTRRSRPPAPTRTTTAPRPTTVAEPPDPDPPRSTTVPVDRSSGGARGSAEPGPDTFEPDPVGGTTTARGRADGTGYSMLVPTGWNDGAKRFEGSSVAFDRSYVKGRGSAVTSSILVVRTTPAGARSRGIDGLAGAVERQLAAGAGGAEVADRAERQIDGEDAVGFIVRRTLGDTAIVQRQVAVVRGRALFTIALTAARRTYTDDARTFARFLDSWRWAGEED